MPSPRAAATAFGNDNQVASSRNVRPRVAHNTPRRAAVTQPEPTGDEGGLSGASSQDSETPDSSLIHVQPDSQHQRQPLTPLLSSFNIPSTTVPLPIHPAPGSLQNWQQYQNNQFFYPARLVGKAEHPDIFVGLGAHELLCHSQWAARNLQQAGTDSVSMQLVLPVCTEQETVRKLVQALYSGSLSFSNDAEQILMLADSIQCTVVEKACVSFLTSLNLDASSLAVLMRLWERINHTEAEQLTLQRLVSKPWTHETPRIIASVYEQLLQPGRCKTSLCRDVLDHPSCGALCQLQVFDVLIAAGILYSSMTLGRLFSVNQLSAHCFDLLQLEMNLTEANGISYPILAESLRRASGSNRWRDIVPRVRPSTACLPLDKTFQQPVYFNLKGVLLALGHLPACNERGWLPSSGSKLRVAALDRTRPSQNCHVVPYEPIPLGSLLEQLVVYIVRHERPFVQFMTETSLTTTQCFVNLPDVSINGTMVNCLHRFGRVDCGWLIGMWVQGRVGAVR